MENKISNIEKAFVELAGTIASLGTTVCETLKEQEREIMYLKGESIHLKSTIKQAAQRIIDNL